MTKARDLANSAAAFSAVSATELGYVDGVTSAIQTQLDAKQASSTAVTLTGTQTLTNKTLTSPVISSITNTGTITLPSSTDTLVGRATTDTLTNKTLTSPALTTPTISTATTNGDLLYGTGSGALTRLGIGSSAQVLTVSGGVPSWATPAAGGGWTLINSGGTALGSGVTTVSSIPGTYQQIRVWVVGFKPSAIDLVYRMTINGDTGANYLAVPSYTSTVTNVSFGGTNWQLNINGISNDANTVYNFNEIVLSNYASTTAYKVGQSLNFYRSAAGGATTNWGLFQDNVAWGSASAITSLGFETNGTGFSAGTIYVYGVK